MTSRPCARCSAELKLTARADARFCSTRCRVAAHRAGVPAELRERDRWVRRAANKAPLRCSGRLASSTNPKTWVSYDKARRSTVGVGLGFVLNGDGVVCVDLDHCLVDGVLTPEARALLARLPRTYVEVSPSGDGLHVWGLGRVERGSRRTVRGVAVEVYGSGRYITVTRDVWRSAGLADIQRFIDSLSS